MHRAVTITRDLIAIPSVNAMGKAHSAPEIYSERKMAFYLLRFLAGLGLETEIIAADEQHPNIMARMEGETDETVLLEAHMDTVSHLNMTIDPFDPKIENERLYGRGSCDTKASLATYLYAMEWLVKHKVKPRRNLILLAVHNEEYNFGGIRECVEKGLKADYALVGEPTSLNIIHAHKGVCRFTLETRGKNAHGALPWLGENAIYGMSDVLQAIKSYEKSLKRLVHSDLGCATINVGTIEGGLAVNIVPARCRLRIDRRLLPGETAASVIAGLKKALPENVPLTVSGAELFAPAVHTPRTSRVCALVEDACRRAGVETRYETAHFATDASVLSAAGIPAVVFGPGSIEQAHTPDEYIETEQIEKAAAIILNLLRE